MVEIKRIDSFRRKRTVRDPADDIQRLNEKLLLLASDPAIGGGVLRLLGGGQNVNKRIRSANAHALGTAIRCGVPLVEFTQVLEELAASEPRDWRFGAGGDEPEELRALALFTLNVAHDLTLRNATIAKRYFCMTRRTAETLAELAVSHLEALARGATGLLRLRLGNDLGWWDRVMIGDHCVGPRAARIAHMAAQQSLASR